MYNNSTIITNISKFLLPFVMIFGIYVVVTGADSVGGGFQGGAVLSAVFILRYLIHPERQIRIKILSIIEKMFMTAFIALAFLMVGRSMSMSNGWGEIWMLLLNCIIAVKVCCGLSIIFFRYIFFEGR